MTVLTLEERKALDKQAQEKDSLGFATDDAKKAENMAKYSQNWASFSQ